MSLTASLLTASSGLQAAQASLRAVSDNIANVNTPGYVRKAIDQQPLVVDGRGMGVKINGVKRITDQYLQLASLTAASDSQKWGAISQYLDNAQSLFGDPGGEGFFWATRSRPRSTPGSSGPTPCCRRSAPSIRTSSGLAWEGPTRRAPRTSRASCSMSSRD